MKRLLLTSLVGMIILFVWGFVSWTVLPFAQNQMQVLPLDEAVAAELAQAAPEAGVYAYPGPAEGDDPDAHRAQHQRYLDGPVITLMLWDPDGINPMDPMNFVWALVVYFVTTLLGALLATQLVGGYGARVAWLMVLGLFAYFFVDYPLAVWFDHPLRWTLLLTVMNLVGWLLVSLVVAKMIPPRTAAA